MSETNAISDIETAVKSVTGYGVCYTRLRWAAEWPDFLSLFKTTVSSVDQVRGWQITLTGAPQTRIEFGALTGYTRRELTYKITGIMGLDDDADTETTFKALAIAVVEALDASVNLHTQSRFFYTAPASLVTLEPRLFGGVLCHYAEIQLIVQEVL